MKFPDVKFVQTDATREALTEARVMIDNGTCVYVCNALPNGVTAKTLEIYEASCLIENAISDALGNHALRHWAFRHNDYMPIPNMRTYRIAWIDHMLQNR